MRALATRLSLLSAAVTLLAAAAPASAEYLIPPDNSAVNQYTEAYPTAGGARNPEGSGRRSSQPPARSLGKRNANRLEARGEEGRVVAEVAAETAPASEPAPAPTGGETDPGGDTLRRGDGAGEAADDGPAVDEKDAAGLRPGEGPGGSAGAGEVLAQATGLGGSGGTGLLLPLLVLGTAIWAIAYLVRERRRTDP